MIIKRKPKEAELANDYERMVPEFHSNSVIFGEHMLRYEAVSELVIDKVVLDIASGSGYGTQTLAKTAKHVYGVDVFPDAIAYAIKHYGGTNIEYKVGDAAKIPLPTGSVDVVVSFETIEHLDNYRKFLQEVKRVLKSDGLFAVSTPNDAEFAEGNIYHVHEFKYNELISTLHEYFSETKEYLQFDWVATALISRTVKLKDWSGDMRITNHTNVKKSDAVYFFLLCANRPIREAITPLGSFAQHWSERKNLQNAKEIRDQMHELKQARESTEVYAKDITEKYHTIVAERDIAQRELDHVRAELGLIIGSRAWRVITFFKHVWRRFIS